MMAGLRNTGQRPNISKWCTILATGIVLALVLVVPITIVDQACNPQTVNFAADNTTDFLNPERGWMLRGNESIFGDARTGAKHNQSCSVVWSDVWGTPWNGSSGNPFRLDNYRTRALPSSLLQKLAQVFAAARSAGIKLKVRFAYNYSKGGRDTTQSWMVTHIGQLGPLLMENADTIASMDAGFIGYWGEMHSSDNIFTTSERGAVINALMAATPERLQIGVRYPYILRELFGDPPYKMDSSQRFSGSNQSRVGWYNDCLWSNRENTGTYKRKSYHLDRRTFMAVGRYAATSGESCDVGGLNSYNGCGVVLQDMESMNGPDTLFRSFWEGMYERWIAEGCYGEISCSLGYRLQLVSATLPTCVTPGSPFSVTIKIRNTGFGKVYNPRPLDVAFAGGNGAFTARLTPDAREQLPLSGETVSPTWAVNAPVGLKPGEQYQLYLWLPDPSDRLASDSRYAIRLANRGVWDGITGQNSLKASVKVY